MVDIMSRLKKKIEKIDKEIVSNTVKLKRSIARKEMMTEEITNNTGVHMSYQEYGKCVEFYEKVLCNLKAEKERLISSYCKLAFQKEKELAKQEKTNIKTMSIAEENFKLNQMRDDLNSIMFAYDCMIAGQEVKINIAIEDDGRAAAETIKEQAYLTRLQTKKNMFEAKLTKVQERLDIVSQEYNNQNSNNGML